MDGKIIRIMDFETDPFKVGRIPRPFCIGSFDGELYTSYWGDDVIEWYINYLEKIPTSIIYAHNGGNFDFCFLRKYWRGDPIIINGRITKVYIGKHEFRDSFKLLPVALRVFGGKKDIDYQKMIRSRREKNKPEILDYLQEDCVSLYGVLRDSFKEFGLHLTIGSAAIKQLESFHDYECLTPAIDMSIRPYFFGGRNQCFETGVLHGPFKIYDVNSMYPYVMKEYKHPIGPPCWTHNKVTKRTGFIRLRAKNHGALPMRSANGSLSFSNDIEEYLCSVHEYHAGIETGTLEVIKIIETLEFKAWGTFDKFVNHFYGKRLWAKKNGLIALITIYKLLLNNAYGKFSTDPLNFQDYRIDDKAPTPTCTKSCKFNCGKCWDKESVIEGNLFLWKRPATAHTWQYYNVATGASITGAARAVLLRALAKATRPIYCDTDSIICEHLDADLDASALGAWKLEGAGDLVAIAGKKTYAVFNGKCKHSPKLECSTDIHKRPPGCALVKKASKGADLTPQEIIRVAQGDEVEYANPVPKFKLSGKTIWINRKIKRTGEAKKFRG